MSGGWESVPEGTVVYAAIQASAGAPSIRLFQAGEAGDGYLSDVDKANAQVDSPLMCAVIPGDGTAVALDGDGFKGANAGLFLMEALTEGSGALYVWTEVCGNSEAPGSADFAAISFADLLNGDPELFSYARYRPAPNGDWVYNNLDASRASTLVFAHGYNVPDENAVKEWFPTVFKRLYWMGFQGNFAGISWDGDDGWTILYNRNVFRAMYSAPQVADLIRNIPGPSGSHGPQLW